MRYEYLLLCLVLSTGLSVAHVTAAEKKVIIVARSAATPKSEHTQQPTVPPLRTSTPVPLTAEIKATAAPTKAPVAIVNEPPIFTAKTTEKEVAQEVVPEAHPLPAPPTNVSAPQEQALPRQANPLLVTGFITENGNIYEVTDKNGIGMIEPRQSSPIEAAQHVCNYGAIVIYSDVPCNEANVRIGDVHHKVVSLAHREQMSEESQQSPIAVEQVGADKNVTTSNANTNPADSSANNDETVGDVDVTQPKPTKKRRRVNKNSSNKRRRNGYDSRPNSVRQGSGSRRRQQAEQQQQRRRLQNNRNKQQQQTRRRVQQQQEEEEPVRRRIQHTNSNGQRRHGSNNNRRRYVVYDDYDY